MHSKQAKNIDDLFRYKEARLKQLLNVHASRANESKEDDLMIQEMFGDLEIPSLPSPQKRANASERSETKKKISLELRASEREIQLQQMLEQTSLDMTTTLQEKQHQIDLLTEQLKEKTQLLQQTKDQYLSLKHFTSQFASNVKLLVHKDFLNSEEKVFAQYKNDALYHKQNYCSRSIAELTSFLEDKQAQTKFISQKRRASLNTVPFDHHAATVTLIDTEPLPDHSDFEPSVPSCPQPFVYLASPTEDQMDFLFHRVVFLSRSSTDGSVVVEHGGDAYLVRKAFLNMMLALDAIDDKYIIFTTVIYITFLMAA